MASGAFDLIDVTTAEGWSQVADVIDEEFAPDDVVSELQSSVNAECKRILVEHFYNDKDYRSTYYNFYAKKGYRYEINCIRLHFLDDAVELSEGCSLRALRGEMESHYFGYMVLRPTRFSTIGRSVISPKIRKDFRGHYIAHNHKVHLLGHTLHVDGFPSMSQHTDIAVCAHVACWSILRHYSERYSRYREFLTYDITRLAHEFDPGGLVPSQGLLLEHAERIFAAAGTFPVIVPKSERPADQEERECFYRQLFAYVESGFPLFAALEGHAIAIVGHLDLTHDPNPPRACTFAWDRAEGLVAVDDNFLPYTAVPRGRASPYGCDDITDFIVPLPDKIYYPAEAVDRIALLLATQPTLGFDATELESPVVRYFLTTAARLRAFVQANRSQFDPVLVTAIMELALPQFVWVVEIAGELQWRAGQVEIRAIIDATAGPFETQPVFLIHDQERAYLSDRGGDHTEAYLTLAAPGGAPLSRMIGNLRSR